MNPLRALYSRFRRRLACKKVLVLLVMWDRRLVITRAHRCQSGWVARWIGNSDAWSLLHPDGTTSGTDLVKAWKPYQGMPQFDPPASGFTTAVPYKSGHKVLIPSANPDEPPTEVIIL